MEEQLCTITRKSDGIRFQEYGLHDRKCGFPKRAPGRVMEMPLSWCEKFFGDREVYEITPVTR